MKIRIYIIIAVCLLIGTKNSQAKVTLPALFTNNMVLQRNTDVKIWGWADKESKILVTTSWNESKYETIADKQGNWSLKLKTPEAGGPYSIIISDNVENIEITDVLIGEVWLCAGQSNMEMPMKGFFGQPVDGSNIEIVKSKNNNIRFISIPRSTKTIPQKNFEGSWQKAQPATVSNFSATAYYYGKLLQEVLDIPIGLVEVSYGGSCVEAWTSHENTHEFNGKPVPKIKDSTKIDNRTPSALFNGMLHPVIGYTIKGAIWYQGETNYINADKYTERFATMVSEWRNLWQQGNFPFYYTQIAPFDYSIFHNTDDYKEKYSSAYLREAQLKARDTIPNCEMAVTIDCGEKDNIHPLNKKTPAQRLAYIALAKSYSIKGFGYAPPVVKDTQISGNTIVVSFDNIPNGISSYGKEVTCFEIAGKNKVFYPAQTYVRRKSVVLSSPRVKEPVAVRYAFKDFVKGQLFSTEGIPAPSFRTDDW